MGWASGTELYDKLIDTLVHELPDEDETRIRIHLKMIEAFEDADWDCTEECLGQDEAFDRAFELHNGAPPGALSD